MNENPLLEMLAENVSKFKITSKAINAKFNDLIPEEKQAFPQLKDFWMKNNFNPSKCEELLNLMALGKNKHPMDKDLLEKLQDFRRLCRDYYARDRAIYEAFQKTMGGKSPDPEPIPRPKPIPNPIPKPEPTPQPIPKPDPIRIPIPSPKPTPKAKSFPWLVMVVATILLLGVGGGIGYYMFYLPYKIDKEAPRYYTFTASNTFLRSSQVAGVDYNVLGKIPYGSELIVYNNNSDWSYIKWNNIKGYVSTTLILPQKDFYILNSIFGDSDSKEIINTAKCRLALLSYYKSNGYFGAINSQICQSIFNVESFPPDKILQVFSKMKSSKYNSTFYKRITNPSSKFTDFAVIITNISTQQRKCLLFSFRDDETPQLEYEENAPQTGDIISIDTGVNSMDNTTWYHIKYQ